MAFHTFLDSLRSKKKYLVWPILKQNRAGLLNEGLSDISLLLETGMAVATDVVSLV